MANTVALDVWTLARLQSALIEEGIISDTLRDSIFIITLGSGIIGANILSIQLFDSISLLLLLAGAAGGWIVARSFSRVGAVILSPVAAEIAEQILADLAPGDATQLLNLLYNYPDLVPAFVHRHRKLITISASKIVKAAIVHTQDEMYLAKLK
jgi:hypothetical protein